MQLADSPIHSIPCSNEQEARDKCARFERLCAEIDEAVIFKRIDEAARILEKLMAEVGLGSMEALLGPTTSPLGAKPRFG